MNLENMMGALMVAFRRFQRRAMRRANGGLCPRLSERILNDNSYVRALQPAPDDGARRH